jgi:radical SAM superfamily enzyme
MRKIAFILCIFLNCLATDAQAIKQSEVDIQTGLNDTELQKAIETYLKMTSTETYKAIKKTNLQMMEKLNQEVIPKELANNEEWEKWIANNWKKTKFRTIGEANALRSKGLELTKKQFVENAELFEMIRRATIEQRHQILKPERAGRPF